MTEPERAEQVVLAYLADVGEAAYGRLPHRRRVAFIGDLRSRINAACAAAGARSPEEVRKVLRQFGDPEDVVDRACREDGNGNGAGNGNGTAGGNGNGAGGGGDGDGDQVLWAGSKRPMPEHRVHREPPPWRGGPDRGLLRGASSGRSARRRRANGGTGPGPFDRVRHNPAEAFTVVIYLCTGLIGAISLLWPVGAVLVVLSRVWARRDQWIAVAVPIAATVVGMVLWQGEAPYVDQVIMGSLLSTGVIGLRVAAVACGLYLAVRLLRGVDAS
ncbi:hypothetical protein HNR23_003853 [Nocardiopsis mwathae]|uniref:Uncharacterized protein n=1 Tax=Nocardiopsis mwathae TaxID=1472723 RepID=A0A7X0D6W5_9ACTN|nr:hypothetical protein [Nocardiopsis mwathae]MBB6173793.1 hypothetical protein [Nocardiopsis mwathae]